MTSIVNLGILYLLSLLSLYPFEQQPESLLFALAGTLPFAFHLIPLPPLATVGGSLIMAGAALLQPQLAPFLAMIVYTLTVDINALASESTATGKEVRSPYHLSLLHLACGFAILSVIVLLTAGRLDSLIGVYTLILIGLAAWLGFSNVRRITQTNEAATLQDHLRGMQYAQDRYQETVLIRQDQAAERARLEERERIARDMHDSVGHTLTSALLQAAAIDALSEDESLDELLKQLKKTLDQGMTETRHHLHELEEQAADIEHELEELASLFRYCPVELSCTLTNQIPMAVSQQIMASVREALTNVSKHSGADSVRVELREFSRFYRLVIHDNGRGVPEELLRELDEGGNPRGMGLRSLKQRAESEGGHFVASNDNGFKVFMTFKRPPSIT